MESPILGAVDAGKGRIAVYGDSNCLDSSHMVSNCYWLLKKLLDFTSYNNQDPVIFPATNELGSPLGSIDSPLPQRRSDVDFSAYSLVLKNPLRCGLDSPVAVHGSKGYISDQSTRTIKIVPEPKNFGGGHLQPDEFNNTSRDSASPSTYRPFTKSFPTDSNRHSNTTASRSGSERDRMLEPGGFNATMVSSESILEIRTANVSNWKAQNKTQVALGWWGRDEVSTFMFLSLLPLVMYWMILCFHFSKAEAYLVYY